MDADNPVGLRLTQSTWCATASTARHTWASSNPSWVRTKRRFGVPEPTRSAREHSEDSARMRSSRRCSLLSARALPCAMPSCDSTTGSVRALLNPRCLRPGRIQLHECTVLHQRPAEQVGARPVRGCGSGLSLEPDTPHEFLSGCAPC